MRITYDKQADAMYIEFNDLPIENTQTANDFVNIDMTTDGTVVGIELFGLTHFAGNIDAIAEQYDIKKVLATDHTKPS